MSGHAGTPAALRRFSWILLFFFWGYTVSATGAWPDAVIKGGVDAGKDLAENLPSYVGWYPTRHILPEARHGAGVTIHKPSKIQPGLTFVSGFFGRKHVMKLLTADGEEVHRWTVRFREIFPLLDHIAPSEDRPFNEWLTHIHGAHPFADGSVVFNFDLHGMARVDACGNLLWKIDRMTHHSISLADDGTLWVPSRTYQQHEQKRLPLYQVPFFEDELIQVSPDGEILREISLPELLRKNDLYGIVFPSGFEHAGNTNADFMHTNDAEVLSKETASAFPQFAAGDIAVSMRNLNLVFVFDPLTERVKWYQIGPWQRQHDPDFLEDGTISVFNNRSDNTLFGERLGGSHITRIDPQTRTTSIAYQQPDGDSQRRFFTNIMGKHQTLLNGNILITESLGGRLFEVTPDGEIVWQFVNRVDDDQVALVTSGIRFPASYFDFTQAPCLTTGAFEE